MSAECPRCYGKQTPDSSTDTFTWPSLSEAMENLRSFPGDDEICPEDGKREVGKVEVSLVERCLQKQGSEKGGR